MEKQRMYPMWKKYFKKSVDIIHGGKYNEFINIP
jgi:hypothetical protein